MIGAVFKINATRGMIAIQTSSDGFTILEGYVDDFNIGDTVSWDDDGLGSAEIRNESTGEVLDVIIQNVGVNLLNVNQRLLFT